MVIALKDVPRWVQPGLKANATFSEALVGVTGSATVKVGVAAVAKPAFTGNSSTKVATAGSATFEVMVGARQAPRVTASAPVAVDAVFPTTNAAWAAAAATVPIRATMTGVVVIEGQIVFTFLNLAPLTAVVEGVAEFDFVDSGLDVPVFPMTFPFQFNDVGDYLRWASAEIVLDNTATVDSVSVAGVAKVRLTGSTRLQLQGNLPLFPFRFPAVFDSFASARFGDAEIVLGRQPGELQVELAADAEVQMFHDASSFMSTVFPLALGSAVFVE